MKSQLKSFTCLFSAIMVCQLLALFLLGWSWRWFFLFPAPPIPLPWPEASIADNPTVQVVAVHTTRFLLWPYQFLAR